MATPTEAAWSGDIGHPAHRGPVAEPLQPVRDRVEAESLADQRLDQPVRGELGQLVMAGAHQSRVLLRVEAPVQAEDRVVLDQGVVERGRLNLPSREADHEDPALEGNALGRALVGVSTDRVEHDVSPTTSGDLLDHCDEVLAVTVHDHVSAEPARHLGLLGSPDHTADPGAGGLAALDPVSY